MPSPAARRLNNTQRKQVSSTKVGSSCLLPESCIGRSRLPADDQGMKRVHNLARKGRGRGPRCPNQRKNIDLSVRYGRSAAATAQADDSYSHSSQQHPQKRHILHKTISMLKFMTPALILPLSDPLMSLVDAISLGKVCYNCIFYASRSCVHMHACVD